MTIYEMIKNANEGDPDIAMQLSNMCSLGYRLQQSDENADKWLKFAVQRYIEKAKEGDAHAAFTLASMHENGGVISKDPEQAKYWLSKAVELCETAARDGNGLCAFTLSNLYKKGRVVDQSDVEALNWLNKAFKDNYGNALAGSREALNHLMSYGLYYEEVRDYKESWDNLVKLAFETYSKGAHSGNIDDQYRLGCMYATFTSDYWNIVKSDYDIGRTWLRKAALKGHIDAQKKLALSYMNTIPGMTEKDPVEAFAWMLFFEKDGLPITKIGLHRIIGDMTSEQLDEAQKRHLKYKSIVDGANVS